jgi:hypothetical protein
MIEGSGSVSGSGSILLTNGSRSRRPKNMWSRWIQIWVGSGSGTLLPIAKEGCHSWFAKLPVVKERWFETCTVFLDVNNSYTANALN